jgi:hypothetical protein
MALAVHQAVWKSPLFPPAFHGKLLYGLEEGSPDVLLNPISIPKSTCPGQMPTTDFAAILPEELETSIKAAAEFLWARNSTPRTSTRSAIRFLISEYRVQLSEYLRDRRRRGHLQLVSRIV